jgi:hypothetical protein
MEDLCYCSYKPIKICTAIYYRSNSIYLFGILHTIAIVYNIHPMAKPRSAHGASKSILTPKTMQRTYRFDSKTFAAFEEDCAQHLANPKRVIEALILHWLDAGAQARAAMAQTHRRRIGATSGGDE